MTDLTPAQERFRDGIEGVIAVGTDTGRPLLEAPGRSDGDAEDGGNE